MRFINCIVFVSLPLLFGCAATYKGPLLTYSPKAIEVLNKTQDLIFSAALSALAEQGYTITLSDRQSGIISTGSKRLTLTEKDCDCGSTMGLPYIKDNRTTTNLSINITVTNNSFLVKSNIEGEYLPNDPVYGKKFTCISTGTIEDNIISLINSKLQSK